jgi:hypothetical protein
MKDKERLLFIRWRGKRRIKRGDWRGHDNKQLDSGKFSGKDGLVRHAETRHTPTEPGICEETNNLS